MDEPLKNLMQELGNAINDSLSESDRIADAIAGQGDDIRRGRVIRGGRVSCAVCLQGVAGRVCAPV